jgi:hypothetical protein
VCVCHFSCVGSCGYENCDLRLAPSKTWDCAWKITKNKIKYKDIKKCGGDGSSSRVPALRSNHSTKNQWKIREAIKYLERRTSDLFLFFTCILFITITAGMELLPIGVGVLPFHNDTWKSCQRVNTALSFVKLLFVLVYKPAIKSFWVCLHNTFPFLSSISPFS